jgi:membrane-associated phospholipid phosphatase
VRPWSALLALGIVLGTSTASGGEVEWRDEWPRFRDWQYVSTAALLGGGIALRYGADDPDQSDFSGILFDEWVASELSVRDEPSRWALATLTDAVFYSAVAYRLLDSTLVPGLGHDAWDVSRELAMIDLQAHAVIAAVLWSAQAAVGRERPINAECDREEVAAHEKVCEPHDEHRNRSFISGHVAVNVAIAGLTCLHHAHLPLYGGGTWDDVACGATVTLAAVSAFGRAATKNHWASDVLLGAALGFGAGYLLPAALHYGFDGHGPGSSSIALSRSRRVPLVAASFSF